MCHTAYKSSLHDKVTKLTEILWPYRRNVSCSSAGRFILCFVHTGAFNIVNTNTTCLITQHLWELRYVAAHLFPAVAVISLQMPFDESMWRACLTLQEGTASLHPVLHHLQSVLIGCRAERERGGLPWQPKHSLPWNPCNQNLSYGKSKSYCFHRLP